VNQNKAILSKNGDEKMIENNKKITAEELKTMNPEEFTEATKKLPLLVKAKINYHNYIRENVNYDGLANLLNSNVCRLTTMIDMVKPKEVEN